MGGIWDVYGKCMGSAWEAYGGIWEVYKKYLGISIGAFKNTCGGTSEHVRGL